MRKFAVSADVAVGGTTHSPLNRNVSFTSTFPVEESVYSTGTAISRLTRRETVLVAGFSFSWRVDWPAGVCAEAVSAWMARLPLTLIGVYARVAGTASAIEITAAFGMISVTLMMSVR